MARPTVKDEHYVIDLCDEILGQKALRQHRFDFLRGDGDPGLPLPVDAYYPELSLVIEYREKQHSERVGYWDDKPTTSGIPRGQQRARYDQRRREVLPQHRIDLVEVSYSELGHGGSKRLTRDVQQDRQVLEEKLSRWMPRGG
nr:hypothetical protein 5 [Pseudomonadaceae bacterium]